MYEYRQGQIVAPFVIYENFRLVYGMRDMFELFNESINEFGLNFVSLICHITHHQSCTMQINIIKKYWG
jgi:hypothetical protein